MFRRIGLLGVVSLSLALMGCATTGSREKASFPVAKDGVAQCRIVVAPDAPASTQYAAQELQRFLGEITGAKLPIVPDTGRVTKGEIVVGPNRHFKSISKGKIDIASLGKEGYVVRNTGGQLLIAGGEPRGTLYGVYGLLEEHLGCRWFTPEVSRIPKKATLAIDPLDERVIPVLENREPFVMDCFDGDWAARNRMNGSAAHLDERHGGKVTYFGFVHTSAELVPTEVYYDKHPEYFSLVKGKRLKERPQLCCTNEDVVKIVTEATRKRMREHPEATVFSVSQNDWLNYCECDKCQALAKAEGTQMAPMLSLVNKVADAVAKEFPDKLIDTLAYQYTRKPPLTMRPSPNVIVRLCSIECCFSHSFESCDSPENKAFVDDVKGWSTRCNRLWVWNYDTSFANYLTPYPNLRVRKPNIQFYVKHNVKGIFEQDVYTTLNGELSGLSGYLGAKLLWNPNYDADTAINEFLDAVYGKAARPIRTYIDLLHDKVEKENLHMDIWIGPDHPLLDGGVLDKADALWDEAEKAVAQDPATLARVQTARLSVDFAQIERARSEGFKVYVVDHATRAMTVRPDFAARVKRFLEVAQRSGVTQLRESNGDIATYKKELDAYQSTTAGAPKEAVRVNGAQPGVLVREFQGAWDKLPDFQKLKPVHTGVANEISLTATKSKDPLGLEFSGYFLAPADGLYLFHCRSNDGSTLNIDGEVLIDNDGMHKLATRSCIVALKKGYHALQVRYFDAGGNRGLEVAFEGPGIEKQIVPATALWHTAAK